MATLKGKAVIGQSGGPTCVINQTLVGAALQAREHPEIEALYGALHGIDGILGENFIDLGAESVETLERVAQTPSAGLGSVRRKPDQAAVRELVSIFKKNGVRYLFYIGGNDSAETAHIVSELSKEEGYEIRVCHLPKTIDNDLRVTDHCPGYGSAARFVALALMGDNLDNRSLGGVKIDVIMGRHAGFLTAAAGLGRQNEDDGPHLIYVPERAFDIDKFCGDVDRMMTKHGRCLVAVSEGIAFADGSPVFTSGEKDSHGNVQLSGTGALGDFLSQQVKEKVGVKRVRADTFGYLQRCFPTITSEVDAREARAAGAFGMKALASGETTGASVSIRRTGEGSNYESELFLTELSSVAKETRDLDDEFIAEAGNDTTEAFRQYALPLVGELPVPGRLGAKKL
ncbi:MAG: 6-phosphofructokinase [Planctomycetota bacterium]